jgi:hypothetical protein
MGRHDGHDLEQLSHRLYADQARDCGFNIRGMIGIATRELLASHFNSKVAKKSGLGERPVRTRAAAPDDVRERGKVHKG